MKVQAYVIYDSKAKIYNKPFYFINNEVALRAAIDLVSDLSTDVGKNPQDFSMYRIGTFDDESAQFDQCNHETICRFHELDPNPKAPIYPIQPQESVQG